MLVLNFQLLDVQHRFYRFGNFQCRATMLEAWQNLVLKWLNCFGVGLIENIQDVKKVNFLKVLRSCSSSTDDDPFTQLLTLLQNLYPHFDLDGASSHCWDDDEELYTLSSLLLLHASIFDPTKALHQNAAVNLNGVEQRLVVDFLEKAMNHEQKITKQSLLESLPTCVPTVAEDTSETQDILSASPSSPVLTNKKRRSQGTPLTEFLSSPVARQKRKSGQLRERLCSLENDLEEEQAERAKHKAQIAELEKICREKSEQIRALKEDLRKLEDGQEVLSRDTGDKEAERRRLYMELTDSENYIKKLEAEMEEIKSTRDTAVSKLTVAEKQSAEFEELFNECRIECSKLKTELELFTEENSELKFKCSQLERDLNQIQSCTLLSPRRPLLDSPNRSFSPAPENLGFIVEKEMIDKENENIELKRSLKDLDDELQKFKSAYRELTDKSQRESEAASRLQKKLEAKLSDMQSTVDSTYEELNTCKKAKDDLSSRLSDISIEKGALGKQLSELTSTKSTLATELKSVNDAKHFLEVKVAKLEAKLLMSAEREKELQDFSTKRAWEMDEIKQKMDAKDVELKKCLKVQKMIEEELNDTRRKLTLAKNYEQEKYDLEEQVMALKQAREEFVKKIKSTSESHDKLQNQWHTLSEEKRSLLSELKDLSIKNEDLASALSEVSAQKTALANEKLSLLKEKVCWEEQLQETSQHLQDVKDKLAREDLEKKIVQDKLAEALAANDRLSSNLSIAAQQESDLTATLADMSRQKKAIENQLHSAQKERDQLQISLQETLSQLEGLTRAKENLNQDLGVKLGEIKNVSSRMTELSNEKVKLESKLAEEIAGRMMLQTQLMEVQENLKLAQSEISQVKTELDVSLKQCEERSFIIANLEAEKNDIEDDLSHYGKRLNEQMQENDSLKAEILSLKEEKEKISLECESKAKNISDMQEKLTHVESILHRQLGELSVERDGLSAQLKSAEDTLTNLEKELCALRTTNETQQEQLLTQSSQIADLLQKQRTVESAMEELSLKNKCLLDECDEKSEQLMMLRVDLVEVQSASESLQKEQDIFKEQVHLLSNKNASLEEDVVQHITQIETLADQLKNITSHASKQQAEKEDAVNKLETAQNAMKDLEAKLESKCRLVEELTSALQTKDLLLTQSLASDVSRGELLSKQQIEKEDAVNKLETAQNAMKDLEAKLESKCKLVEELTSALQSKDLLLTQSQASDVSREELLSSCSEKMTSLMQEREKLSEELRNVQAEKQQTHTSLEQLRTEKSGKENDFLVAKAELTGQITYLQGEVEKSAAVRQNLEEKCEKTEEMLQQHKEMLVKSREDKEVLLAQIDELQSAVDVKEELLCDTQKCIEKLRAERDKLRDLLTVKDQIIITHKNTESSLERQSNDELEVAMKLLEGEVHSSHSTSEMMAQELRKAQQNFEAEKVKLEKALEEAQSTAKSFQQETVELKQQLTGPRAGGKLAALQQEEKIWKLDRMKNHLEFQFDSLMTQKIDVEDHLNQLREILKDVSCICDTLFASLPGSCDAVHEVTVMKKEVESKLRAVDKKYADSLCGIISLAHEMFVLRKKQTEDVLSDNVTNGSVVPSDKENIEIRVSKSCEAMTSLMCDVRSAINSCKFLIERCESYLKAQTRESLKIKMTIKEEIPDVASQSGESKLFQSSGSMGEKSVANFTDDFKNCSHDKSEWFGGSTTLEEGYNAMKKSHANLELRIAELSKQLKDLQTSVPEQVHNDMGSKMAKLQDRINVLMLRPTQEQLDDKLKELHNHYSNKLENMKTKMKQIVKDEVEKVEEEKIKSEKEIIAKYSKRISEFEEHVQQLSAQLWKLGEKLLQEQQDHKNAKENLAALKERQRQYLMSKQRTQSLDRLDRLGQGTKKTEPVAQLKRRCNSQIAQSSLVSTKVHPSMDDTFDIVDEGSSRRSTMMAPASMGLAFPEEDEDGEVFNNDYLAELKEGKCKVPSDGRLSELQYRNSLCPPHLKSSYPLETQFHDPQSLRDEEIKGPDRRLSRQGKDRGTRVTWWPRQTLTEQKRMLLQLRHVLSRPKPGRRPMIHSRSHWSEIRGLSHPTQVCTSCPFKYADPMSELNALSILPSSCEPRKSKGPKRSSQSSKTAERTEIIPLGLKSNFRSVRKLLQLGGKRQQPNTKNCESSIPWTPKSCKSDKKLKCQGGNVRTSITEKNYASYLSVKTNPPTEKKGNRKRQDWMDLMPSKSRRNSLRRSPYMVYPCIPPPKVPMGKIKVRSLLRLEQTPAYQNPTKAFLNVTARRDRNEHVTPMIAKVQKAIGTCSLRCSKPKSPCGKFVGKWSSGLRVSRAGSSTSENRSFRHAPYSKSRYVRRHVSGLENSHQLAGGRNETPRRRSKKGSGSPRKKFKQVIFKCAPHQSYKEMHECLEPVAKSSVVGRGPGSVMAERLACDKRLLSSKTKWNHPRSAKFSKEKIKDRGTEETENLLTNLPREMLQRRDCGETTTAILSLSSDVAQSEGQSILSCKQAVGDTLSSQTSYKKPGPPTPSKKAGRLSLQGKEDVTPRVAALREHNESVTSQGTGILRAGKTTPSRLRALFTSSKVANAATLPVLKKDENSAPATPTSKRLSIFKRRFGSSKENQSAATGYSSLH